MKIEIKLPKLTLSTQSADVSSVLVKEGDRVSEGTPLLELESDKLTRVIEAPSNGTVSKICCHEGDEIPVGAVMIELVD